MEYEDIFAIIVSQLLWHSLLERLTYEEVQ